MLKKDLIELVKLQQTEIETLKQNLKTAKANAKNSSSKKVTSSSKPKKDKKQSEEKFLKEVLAELKSEKITELDSKPVKEYVMENLAGMSKKDIKDTLECDLYDWF